MLGPIALWRSGSYIWAILSSLDNTRCVAFSSGAREAYCLLRKTSIHARCPTDSMGSNFSCCGSNPMNAIKFYLEELPITRLLRSITPLMLGLGVQLIGAVTGRAGSGDFAGVVDIGGGRKMYLEC